MTNKRIIITGGPGFGKTSIIKELERRGYAVSEEKARVVIKKQVDLGSDKLPWKDVKGFSQLVIKEISSEKKIESGIVFCDRGIPDVVGYMKHASLKLEKEEYQSALKSMNYSTRVYFVPPWDEIYKVDNERKESLETAKIISKFIKETYIEEKYTLVEIPKGSVENRSDFIIFDILSHQF